MFRRAHCAYTWFLRNSLCTIRHFPIPSEVQEAEGASGARQLWEDLRLAAAPALRSLCGSE